VARLAILRGIGRQDDQAAVDGKGLEFDAESRSFLVGKGGADFI